MADPQSIVWYPPAMLLRWVPPVAFLSWIAVLHVWFGGVGTLLLGRVVGLSWLAAAAAALCVALGGTSAARLYNGHLLVINTVAWLPWALAFSVITVRRRTLLPHPALVLVMVLQFLAGFPQATASTVPPVYRWLARHGDGGALIELPTNRYDFYRQSVFMYRSVFHRLPLANGYTGYPPKSYEEIMDAAALAANPAYLDRLLALVPPGAPRKRTGP